MGKFGDMMLNEAAGGIGSAVGAGMGLLLGSINDKRQLKQQEKLSEQQMRFAKQMGDYNQKYQLEMWEKTGFQGQMKQLKAAGLNPGLLYGMSGAGGATTGSSNASVPGGGAPVGGGEAMGMMGLRMQQQMTEAQVEVMKSQANKNNVEAAATAGVDTDLKNKQIESLTQGIEESKGKTVLMDVQRELAQIESNFKTDTYQASVAGLKYNTNIALQQLNIMRNDAIISENTWQTKIDMVTGEAAGILLRNELTRRDIENTEADTASKRQAIAAVIQDMQAQLKQLSQKDRELSQGDEHIIIDKARNKLIETGIWVGAGSQVLGDAVNLLKKAPARTTTINNHIPRNIQVQKK